MKETVAVVTPDAFVAVSVGWCGPSDGVGR
jgi:hypothetical protein